MFVLIALYLIYVMLFNALVVAAAVIVIQVYYKCPTHPPSPWVRFLVYNVLAKITFKGAAAAKYMAASRANERRMTRQQRKRFGVSPTDHTVTLDSYVDDARAVSGGRRSVFCDVTPDVHERYEMTPRTPQHESDVSAPVTRDTLLQQSQQQASHRANNSIGLNNTSSGSNGTELRLRQRAKGRHEVNCVSGGMPEPWRSTAEAPPVQINEWQFISEVLDRVLLGVFVLLQVIPTSLILGSAKLFKPDHTGG